MKTGAIATPLDGTPRPWGGSGHPRVLSRAPALSKSTRSRR